MALRHKFPPFGSTILGGTSDGVVYTTAFAGSTMDATLAMVRAFLDEEGYAGVPIPRDGAEMLAFLQPEQGSHPHLFARPSYAHNPVRLVLPKGDRRRRKLVVELYNEAAPGHLLRFHRRGCPDEEARVRRAVEERGVEEFGGYMTLPPG